MDEEDQTETAAKNREGDSVVPCTDRKMSQYSLVNYEEVDAVGKGRADICNSYRHIQMLLLPPAQTAIASF